MRRRISYLHGELITGVFRLMDVGRAARLGWKAKVAIPEGLKLTYDWYLKNVSVETGAE